MCSSKLHNFDMAKDIFSEGEIPPADHELPRVVDQRILKLASVLLLLKKFIDTLLRHLYRDRTVASIWLKEHT